MGKRYKIGKSYVERDKKGQFKNWVNIGRSLQADRIVHSLNKIKPGYGHIGDQ